MTQYLGLAHELKGDNGGRPHMLSARSARPGLDVSQCQLSQQQMGERWKIGGYCITIVMVTGYEVIQYDLLLMSTCYACSLLFRSPLLFLLFFSMKQNPVAKILIEFKFVSI